MDYSTEHQAVSFLSSYVSISVVNTCVPSQIWPFIPIKAIKRAKLKK